MRYYDNGSHYTVKCSARDVGEFADQWPGFGPAVPIWFRFHKNDDLVEMGGETDQHDQGGLLRLSHDAQAYAKRFLGAKQ